MRVLNPNLCEGKFASAFLCTVKFDKIGRRLQGNRRVCVPPGMRDDTGKAPVLGSRLRRASGAGDPATPMPTFTALGRRGCRTPVEAIGALRTVVACHRRPRRERRRRRARVPAVWHPRQERLRTRRRSTARAAPRCRGSPAASERSAPRRWRSGGWPSPARSSTWCCQGVVGLPAARAVGRASGGGGDGNTEPQPLEPVTRNVAVRQRSRRIREVFKKHPRRRSVARWRLPARRRRRSIVSSGASRRRRGRGPAEKAPPAALRMKLRETCEGSANDKLALA